MLIDSHIHVGQYYNRYYSPAFVSNLLNELNVNYYAVASTTQCKEDYKTVLNEIIDLLRLDKDKVLPILWITPYGLEGSIQWYLESEIKWRMLKIHPFLNQNEWSPEGELFAEVIDLARELKLPLLIHTGDEECCQSYRFETIITNNPDIDVILAHGRPIEQAIRLGKTYPNVYIDSAFMAVGDMQQIIKAGISNKLLWGTDMCIPQYFYPKVDLCFYYKNKLKSLRNICDKSQYEAITFRNALTLFNL